MLIPFSECMRILRTCNINISGILHIGAHDCEELNDYMKDGIHPNSVYWIDANQGKVDTCKKRGIPNVYCQAIDNKEGEVEFFVTNNGQSSSLLEFGTHAESYPYVTVSETQKVQVNTIINWVQNNMIPIKNCEFWNFDIQGKELDALKSAGEYLHYARALYLEINTQEVYKGCGLVSEIDSYVGKYGFTRVKTSMTSEGWGDALYVRD